MSHLEFNIRECTYTCNWDIVNDWFPLIGYKCIYCDDHLLMIVIHNSVLVIFFLPELFICFYARDSLFASILVHCVCTFRLLLTIWDIAQVDSYLLNEEGKRYKQMIWEEMNREYIEVPLLTVFSYHFVILRKIVVMHPKYNDKMYI